MNEIDFTKNFVKNTLFITKRFMLDDEIFQQNFCWIFLFQKFSKFWSISSSINLWYLRSTKKNVDFWICFQRTNNFNFFQFFNIIFFLGTRKTWNSSNWSKIGKHVQNVAKIINNFWRFKFETRSPYLQNCFVGKYCFHHQGISK